MPRLIVSIPPRAERDLLIWRMGAKLVILEHICIRVSRHRNSIIAHPMAENEQIYLLGYYGTTLAGWLPLWWLVTVRLDGSMQISIQIVMLIYRKRRRTKWINKLMRVRRPLRVFD